jgi:hypothetical protein
VNVIDNQYKEVIGVRNNVAYRVMWGWYVLYNSKRSKR